MNESGKKITLRDREYTIFEHDTVGIPYRLVDENNNTYFLLLRDDRATNYYFVTGLLATKFLLPKEELEAALNPPKQELIWNVGSGLKLSSGNNISNPNPFNFPLSGGGTP